MVNLHSDERVLCEVRRHWIVLLRFLVPLILFLFVPVLLWSGFIYLDQAAHDRNAEALFGFMLLGWFLTLWVAFFVIWTNYYLDALIITDQRLVDIEQHAFFSRDISECSVEKVEDVTVEVHGFLATFFDFGNVHVQTAGESAKFVMTNVPHPHEAKEMIFKAKQAYEEKRIALLRV